MNERYLFKANRINTKEWVQGFYAHTFNEDERCAVVGIMAENDWIIEANGNMTWIDKNTLCQSTGLKDKHGNLIWENDILKGHDNQNDLVKVAFGEFSVIDVESLEAVDGVIGWHTEVIPTDELSQVEPFCLSMPLTDFYIKRSEYEVISNIFDNSELLER